MDLLQIQYFQKVAELQHMTKAAQELHIAQPSLSKTIHQLEEDLGVPLFNRKSKYIVLNEAGEIFLHYANIITDAIKDARHELEEYAITENATIHISQRVASVLFSELIGQFHKQYPSVRFVVDQHQHLLNHYRKDAYDFVFFSSMTNVQQEGQITILDEPILLAVSPDHPLADRESVRLTDLDHADWIRPGPIGNNLLEILNNYFRIAEVTPRIIMDCDDYVSVKAFVRTGVGFAMVPQISWFANEDVDELRYIPFAEPEVHRCINMTWKTSGYISKAAVLFRDFVLEMYAKMQIELEAVEKK